jgi:hypothetical protein
MAIGDARDDGYMKPATDDVVTAARRWRLENGCGDGVARLGHGATPFTETDCGVTTKGHGVPGSESGRPGTATVTGPSTPGL